MGAIPFFSAAKAPGLGAATAAYSTRDAPQSSSPFFGGSRGEPPTKVYVRGSH
jgi:hypothetical protein